MRSRQYRKRLIIAYRTKTCPAVRQGKTLLQIELRGKEGATPNQPPVKPWLPTIVIKKRAYKLHESVQINQTPRSELERSENMMQCEGSMGEAMRGGNLWGRVGRRWKCVEKSTQWSRIRRGEERSGVGVSGRVSGWWHSGAKNSLGQYVYQYIYMYNIYHTRIYGLSKLPTSTRIKGRGVFVVKRRPCVNNSAPKTTPYGRRWLRGIYVNSSLVEL